MSQAGDLAPAVVPTLEGMIEVTAIRQERPYATGWFRPPQTFIPPFNLSLKLGETEVVFGEIVLPTADEETDQGKISFDLHHSEPWTVEAGKKVAQSFIIRDAQGAVGMLRAQPRMLPLALSYKDRQQFFRHVQDPGKRHPNSETVAFHAIRFLNAQPPETIFQAAALTILGYRALEASPPKGLKVAEILERAGRVLEDLSSCGSEPEFRWFISLTMVCHYLRIYRGEAADSIDQLRQVVGKWEKVELSPAQAANTLKAIFHLGSLLWKMEKREEAEEIFLLTKDVVRKAAAIWRFTSWFSANEFVNTGMIARSCLLRLEMLHFAEAGVWRDESYARASKDPNIFNNLGFPSARMLKQGQI